MAQGLRISRRADAVGGKRVTVVHFGATLKLLRVDAGVSLRALARQVGVSSAYLSRVENGHDAAPTPERLMAIASALELPADTLVELANQTGAAGGGYIERVPAASAFFLEVARRDLDATQLARLRELMDSELRQPDPQPSRAPSLSALIDQRVIVGLACDRIEDIIDAGSARCATRTHAAESIASLIRQRELPSPTLLGDGVAVPHAIVPGANAAVCVVVPAQPVAINNHTIDAAFVLVSGEAGRPHLDTLAQIARLTSLGIAGELRKASSPRRALTAIAKLAAS